MHALFFDGWASIGRVALLGLCAYAAIVVSLRAFGSRSLSQMSAFDFVITVALGSVLASIPLSTTVSAADGLALILTLLLLQALTRWLLRRFPATRTLIRSSPHLVVWNGVMLEETMRELAVTDAEIRAAVRKAGKASLFDTLAVVLENDGSWSVIGRPDTGDHSALQGLAPPDSR